MTDRLLAGRYRVGERIGGGGMSLVYRADDLQLGREVAVKVLRGQFGNDEEFVRRFRREAQNAASLSHPNVVQIYDVGEEDGQHYIVMELVQGKTLKQLIQEQGPLPVADAARIAVEVLSALAHAHMHRIVHRDVKPHNILISREGRVKVADFGIARAITTDTVTRTGSIMGSAHYFSPEQANGQPTGEKSDIYSVGVVLYEMVTGGVPFQGESPITVALKHLREEPVPPAQLNPEVPLELQQIIMRALEKEPDDRFPSADAMRAALQQFIVDHAAGRTHIHSGDFPTMDLRAMKGYKLRREIDGEARPVAKTEKNTKRRRRRWVLAVVLLLLAAGAVFGLTYGAMKILNVPEVPVPNIVGMPLQQAQQVLTDAHLGWKALEPQFSDTVPQNSVISTQPDPGETVKQGRTISLVLSKGPDVRQVPDVRNKSEDDARNQLESNRFTVGDVTRKYSPTVPLGQVIDMSPPPLTTLNAGGQVNLVVSLGPLKVPKIWGKSLTDAQKMLTQAGLVVGRIDYRPDATKPKDTVLSSDPPQDTPVGEGSMVNLTLAQGSTATGTAFTKPVTVPGQKGESHQVGVNLVDQVSGVATEQVLLSPTKANAGDKITVQGTFFGDAYLKVIIDGKDAAHVGLP